MKNPGDFIGGYRVLTLLSSDTAGELYLVEHPFHGDPAILLLWPSIELNQGAEIADFRQKSTGSIVRAKADHIPVLDAGIDLQHPYIVTAHSEETEKALQEYLSFWGLTFQSIDQASTEDGHTRAEAFLPFFALTMLNTPSNHPTEAFAVTRPVQEPVYAPYSPLATKKTPIYPRPPLWQRLPLWQRVLSIVLIVVLVGWGLIALYIHIPALAATIAITPVQKTLNQSYLISVSTNRATTSTAIQGRVVSFTSPRHTQTVAATGKGHHDATHATGNIVVTQIQLTNPSQRADVGPSSLDSLSGVAITTLNDVTVSQGGTVTFQAQADQAGSGGNIAAYDVNFPVDIYDIFNTVVGTGYATNPQNFSGGTDASNFSFVQQSDIDHVTTALSQQLTPATRTKVSQNMKSNERMAGDIQCHPTVSSNHSAQAQASNVTVSISTTCSVLAYDPQTLRQAAMATYEADGPTHFGSGYALFGGMQIGQPELINAADNTATFQFQMNGIWSLQWTPQTQAALQRQIAGEPQSDALHALSENPNIQHASITGNWFPGNALPANPSAIKLAIAKVAGLPT